MPNEISVSTGLQVVNGTSSRPPNFQTIQADQAAVGIAETTVSVTTSDTAITLPLTSPGWCQLRNDGANVIDWGPDNGSGAIAIAGEINPGKTIQFEFKSSATNIRVKTVSGTSVLSIVIFRK